LPAEWRNANRVRAGSEVIVSIDNGRLHIQTRDQDLTEAQQIVAKYPRPKVSAVRQLFAERRREARRELRDAARHAKSL